MKRIAFFFIGADRTEMMAAAQRGTLPDSGLRGANFFALREGWHVDVISTQNLERSLPRFVRAVVPMSIVQFLFFPKLISYDAVVASDAFLLGWAVSIFSRTKWIYVAINSSVLIIRHAHHPLRSWFLRRAWLSYAAIVCLAQGQRDDFARFGISEERTSLVHFGVDTKYFDGQGSAEPGDVILSLGKDLSRDYSTVLEAARLCGLPVEIVASRKNIPSGAVVPPNVSIRYDLPLEELRATYARARFAVTALFAEDAFGGDPSGQTVTLEIMGMGRAVVATERAWLSEYLERETDFLPVPLKDPEALAKAMSKLWEDGALRKRLAEHGQGTVRARYSSRRFAGELMQVVERFI